MNLSRIHIVEVLGIDVPLNESVAIPRDLQERILYEQELFESFLDSIKKYAGKAYDKVVTKITDWKDAAVVFGKVLSSEYILGQFTNHFWKYFLRDNMEKFYEMLEKIPLVKKLIPGIKSLVKKIHGMKGWKKFLTAIGIGSIIKWGLDKIEGMSADKIKEWLEKFVSEASLAVIDKISDWKSYIGWLKPIIDGVQILYAAIKPSLDAFKSAFKSYEEADKKNKSGLKTKWKVALDKSLMEENFKHKLQYLSGVIK